MVETCIFFGSIYCPEYIINVYVQYIDIWVFKYFSQVFKFCCIITEISISYSRVVKILNQKNKFTNFFNKISLKIYVCLLVLSGMAFYSIRFSQYYINTNLSNGYFTFYNSDPFGFPEEYGRMILSFFYNSIVSILSVIVIFLIDFYLLKRVKQQNKEKLKMINVNLGTKKSIQKTINDCNKREERITRLIVFNTIFMCIIRLPEIVSLLLYFIVNVLKYSISKKHNNYYVYSELSLAQIIDYGDFMFGLNGTFQFIIFFYFNTNFRNSFSMLLRL